MPGSLAPCEGLLITSTLSDLLLCPLHSHNLQKLLALTSVPDLPTCICWDPVPPKGPTHCLSLTTNRILESPFQQASMLALLGARHGAGI